MFTTDGSFAYNGSTSSASATGALTLRGSVDEVNVAIATLQYVFAASDTSATITYTVNDQCAVGSDCSTGGTATLELSVSRNPSADTSAASQPLLNDARVKTDGTFFLVYVLFSFGVVCCSCCV